MSLSARVAVGPSLRVASLTSLVATGGFVVAAATAVACRPDAIGVVAVATFAGWVLVIAGIVHRHRATPHAVLTLADHLEVGVDLHERPMRLGEPTMQWSAFSLIALAGTDAADRRIVLRYPLFAHDVARADRRALSRFLLWSLRGGGASVHP